MKQGKSKKQNIEEQEMRLKTGDLRGEFLCATTIVRTVSKCLSFLGIDVTWLDIFWSNFKAVMLMPPQHFQKAPQWQNLKILPKSVWE